jgi:hypothetical protein
VHVVLAWDVIAPEPKRSSIEQLLRAEIKGYSWVRPPNKFLHYQYRLVRGKRANSRKPHKGSQKRPRDGSLHCQSTDAGWLVSRLASPGHVGQSKRASYVNGAAGNGLSTSNASRGIGCPRSCADPSPPPEHIDVDQFRGSPPAANTEAAPFTNVIVNVPETITVRMVNASALEDYEMWVSSHRSCRTRWLGF